MSNQQSFTGVIRAVAGVVWRNGRFLAVDRPPGKVLAGWWEFPGGKIDPGEDPETALARELTEELGITGGSLSYFTQTVYEYEHGVVDLTFYHVRDFAGEPSGLEGQRLEWITPEQAKAFRFLPADLEALALLAGLCKP